MLRIERHSYAGAIVVGFSVSIYRAGRYQFWVLLARPVP